MKLKGVQMPIFVVEYTFLYKLPLYKDGSEQVLSLVNADILIYKWIFAPHKKEN